MGFPPLCGKSVTNSWEDLIAKCDPGTVFSPFIGLKLKLMGPLLQRNFSFHCAPCWFGCQTWNKISSLEFSTRVLKGLQMGWAQVLLGEISFRSGWANFESWPSPLTALNLMCTRVNMYENFMIQARSNFRALKGLMRLQGLVRGQSVRRQTMNAMRHMQLLVKIRSQIHSRRIQMMENHAFQRHNLLNRDKIEEANLGKQITTELVSF